MMPASYQGHQPGSARRSSAGELQTQGLKGRSPSPAFKPAQIRSSTANSIRSGASNMGNRPLIPVNNGRMPQSGPPPMAQTSQSLPPPMTPTSQSLPPPAIDGQLSPMERSRLLYEQVRAQRNRRVDGRERTALVPLSRLEQQPREKILAIPHKTRAGKTKMLQTSSPDLPLASARPATTGQVPGPTKRCTECSRSQLSCGSEWGEHHWVVHFMGLISNKAWNPRRTLNHCCIVIGKELQGTATAGKAVRHMRYTLLEVGIHT